MALMGLRYWQAEGARFWAQLRLDIGGLCLTAGWVLAIGGRVLLWAERMEDEHYSPDSGLPGQAINPSLRQKP